MKIYIFAPYRSSITLDLQKFLKSIDWSLDNLELNLSIDCVIFTIQDNLLKVLLTKLYPDADWMLPGGFMLKNEETDHAATRILFQRTGLQNIYLEQFKIFSNPSRFSFQKLFDEIPLDEDTSVDSSLFPERVISIGYFALLDYESIRVTGGEFEEESMWAEIHNIPKLKFDHGKIVMDALDALRNQLHLKPIAYNLLPEKFTMPELQQLYEIILDKPLERSSFQKKMLKWDIYERLEERREGVAHKRPYLYRFDQTKFSEGLRQGIRFGL